MLTHPLGRGIPVDDPRAIPIRREMIRRKGFLRRVYAAWYHALLLTLPDSGAPVLELGSGPSFLKSLVPDLITSDVQMGAEVDVVLDGMHLPLASGSLRGIVMTNVLHHLRDVHHFFQSAQRAVRPGGVLAMIEPWVTDFSRRVYSFHHEPFQPEAQDWAFPPAGPMSGANGALPWIVFARDRARFETEFPNWRLETVEPIMPLLYLLSGGVSMRSLMPGWSFGFWSGVERVLSVFRGRTAMFALIVLRRTEDGRGTLAMDGAFRVQGGARGSPAFVEGEETGAK